MKKRKFAPKFPLFDTIVGKSLANTHFYNIFNIVLYHSDFELKLYKYELFVFYFLKFRIFSLIQKHDFQQKNNAKLYLKSITKCPCLLLIKKNFGALIFFFTIKP